MVKYKQKYLEMKQAYNVLVNRCIDLRPAAVDWRKRVGQPILLYKNRFKIVEEEEYYILYDK